MRLQARFLLAGLTASAVIGCSARAGDPSMKTGSYRIGHGTLIQQPRLGHGPGDIVRALDNYVSGLEIRHNGACPTITMRGQKSVSHPNYAVVYINGARSSNTCVLQTLLPVNVDRVEVYPTGVTQRPGYRSNPGGLILVFMKTGTAVAADDGTG